MLKVAAFTGGSTVPSARFRLRQHIPSLCNFGIAVTEMPAALGTYPPDSHPLRPLWACATLLHRLPSIVRSYRFDVAFLQREMLSTYATLEPLTKRPRVFDVDDAIFLLRNGDFARRLAGLADLVVCGNEYLAEWFRHQTPNVAVVPTAIDTDTYVPQPRTPSSAGRVVIGWIGTAANLKYLIGIEKALETALEVAPNAVVRVVCSETPRFSTLDRKRIEFIKWSESAELQSIQTMDIGIMPLDDSPWARGKCSLKVLQYMACGLPVVISPIGVNMDLVRMGGFAIGAATQSEWANALVGLARDYSLRQQMGLRGRQVAVDSFSVKAIAPQIAKCLLQC